MLIANKSWRPIAVVCLIAVGVALAWTRFDRANVGVPGFYIWERLTGQGHGGRRADIDGVRIYYETFGKGPPVLVLHGGTGILESMHNQIADLAADHLVIAPDSRAHGRSTDGSGPLHYATMAQDMIGLMDALHIAKADVVGWSDGGVIALDLAMHHPDRIGRVVAIGANFDVAGLTDVPTRQNPEGLGVAGQRSVYRRFSPTPDRWPVFLAKVETMWAREPHYSATDLGAIRSPVLVIAGEHDEIRRDHTDALARAIPGARELIIPGASHWAPLEEPEPVDAAIRAFLANER